MIAPAAAGAIGTILLLPGLAFWRRAEAISRWNEQMNAIGNTQPWSEVEPADWRVRLTEVVGIVLTVVAVAGLSYWIVGALLTA